MVKISHVSLHTSVTTFYETLIQDLLSQDHGKTMKLKTKMRQFQDQDEDY